MRVVPACLVGHVVSPGWVERPNNLLLGVLLSSNTMRPMALRDDAPYLWHNCGSLICHDGVLRDIFVHCNDAPGSAYEEDGFGVLLIGRDDSEPDEAPAQVDRLSAPAAVIAEVRRAGPFTVAEQREFAARVEALGALDADDLEAASAADRLFDEVLAAGMGDWSQIGSRSGDSLSGGFSTKIYARKRADSPAWTVLERSSDVNSSCTIEDDGSGRTIFEQFMDEYYPDHDSSKEAG